MVVDFFKNLVRYRVEGARAKAQAKVYSVKARAQSKAASKFNQAVDAPLNKAKAKAKGAAKNAKKRAGGGGAKKKPAAKKAARPQAKAAPKAKGGGESMSWFSRKKQGGSPGAAAPPPEMDMDPGGKTVAIDVSSLVDDRSQDVVGWIVCLNGALRGRDFRLVTGRNVIGTSADCDVVLTDPYLSSKHMAIRHENGVFMLIDLDSTNGSFVNDRRISKTELIDNDKIRIGRTELKFKSLF